MIYVDFQDVFIKDPNNYESLQKDIKLWLREYLDKGMVIFKMPGNLSEASKNDKKSYKVGFLYEMLVFVYPEYTKSYIADIISEQYQMWTVYRQFSTFLNTYDEKRGKFIQK